MHMSPIKMGPSFSLSLSWNFEMLFKTTFSRASIVIWWWDWWQWRKGKCNKCSNFCLFSKHHHLPPSPVCKQGGGGQTKFAGKRGLISNGFGVITISRWVVLFTLSSFNISEKNTFRLMTFSVIKKESFVKKWNNRLNDSCWHVTTYLWNCLYVSYIIP